MDEIIPCMSTWLTKCVECAEIVDYCCEVRRGGERSPSFRNLERCDAPDFPPETVTYHFEIKDKSFSMCVTHLKKMRRSK